MSKKNIIVIIAICAVILGVANILASSAVATTGSRLQELQQESSQLEAQNQELERKIAQKQSLLHIGTRAQELGLITPTQMISLTPAESVALLR